MYNQPLVSCLCPTFGRVTNSQHLVEEAIESFLRQDYSNKELVIVNDCPGHKLVCKAPAVIVLNLERRFVSLGEKYNAIVALSHGDYLAPWEDDDLSLPWRLTLSVSKILEHQADYYNPKRYWFWDGTYHSSHPMGVGHNGSLMSRRAFHEVRCYHPRSGNQDMIMDSTLLRAAVSCGGPHTGDEALPRERWFYINRWNTGSYHLSGIAEHDDYYKTLGEQQFGKGTYVLEPHWRRDYLADIKMALISDA